MSEELLSLTLNSAQAVALARQRARHIARRLGFDEARQVQYATAVSEVARNAWQHAGGGQVVFRLALEAEPPRLQAWVTDTGPGMHDVEAVLAGALGRGGLGLVSARRMVDEFKLESAPGQGTCATVGLVFGHGVRAPSARAISQLVQELAALAEAQPQGQPGPADAVRAQLLAQVHAARAEAEEARAALEAARAELSDLQSELENTNRGVVALYAELDERAEQLRRADEVKTRFFSHMSHEFRTPVNSIMALSQLLLDRVDGDLTTEQARQVMFIRQSAQDLGDLVNDLLDLAKVEAGRITLRPGPFEASKLFSALRGMFRPLATNPAVALIFEEPAGLPLLYSDESKIAQILRNFISNALKFTERGEVRVRALLAPDGQQVIFSVADTGIGIAPIDQERIFHEFGQVENPLQRRVKGTGLGLPLSRRLANLLGGHIELTSELGVGSTFSAWIPCVSLPPEADAPAGAAAPVAESRQRTVLVIDDDEVSRYLLRSMLADQPVRVLEANEGEPGLQLAFQEQPDVILLDLVMPGMDGFEVLNRLEASPATQAIPVIVITASRLEARDRHRLEQRVVAVLSKEMTSRQASQAQLLAALERAAHGRAT